MYGAVVIGGQWTDPDVQGRGPACHAKASMIVMIRREFYILQEAEAPTLQITYLWSSYSRWYDAWQEHVCVAARGGCPSGFLLCWVCSACVSTRDESRVFRVGGIVGGHMCVCVLRAAEYQWGTGDGVELACRAVGKTG